MEVFFTVVGLVVIGVLGFMLYGILSPSPVIPLDDAAIFAMQSPCYFEHSKQEILLNGPLTERMASGITKVCTVNEEGQIYLEALMREIGRLGAVPE